MPDINLHLSPDEMTAYIDIPEGKSTKPSLNILHTLLRRHHVVQGVDNDMLFEIVKGNITGNDLVIASGIPVKAPVDGHIEWFVECKEGADLSGIGTQFLLSDLFSRVKSGDRIARIHHPATGTPGITVTGNHIGSTEAANVEILAGTGTVKENDLIVAAIDGAVRCDGIKVEIRACRTITGNIDSGTIDFDGTLAVEGDIHSGVSIHTSGDILIAGNVNDAEITSGGTVVVNGTITGNGRGSITAQGSVAIRRMTRCSLVSGGNVEVSENAIHSQIIADGSVHINMVVGGSITANTIIAASAGNAHEERTVLDSTRSRQLAKERYDLLKQFGSMTVERADTVEKMYCLVKDGMDEEGMLSETGVQELDGMKTMIESLQKITLSVKQRLSNIEVSERLHAKNSCITADTVFPGTILKSDKQERLINSEEHNVKLV